MVLVQYKTASSCLALKHCIGAPWLARWYGVMMADSGVGGWLD